MMRDRNLWDRYRSTRPHLANTASAEAGRVLMANREVIFADAMK